MEATSPRIRSLLRQADRTASAGKRSAAEKLYRQIIDESPGATSAWIGLAQVVSDPSEQEVAYRRALELDPENQTAKQGLDTLGSEKQSSSEATGPTERDENSSHPPAQSLDEVAVERTSGASPRFTDSETPSPEPGSDGLHVHEQEAREPGSESSVEALYCANHPNRQTHLRCNRCGKPICSSCAKPTPVGYRCPECIREHEDIYYTANALDYVIVAVVTLPLALLSGFLATLLGFFTIFLAAIAGSFIGRLAFRVAGRRRGRGIPQMVAAIVVLGGIVWVLPSLLLGRIGLQLLWMGIYIVVASGAAYWQMK